MVSLLAGLLLFQRPDALSLVETERAFAHMGAAKGVRESFLYYFRADAIAFGKEGPHNARRKLLASPAPTVPRQAKLVWDPICADASGSGDFGYTFGPASVRKISDNSLIPDSTSAYFSVWAKKIDGPWRVVADMGVENPAPPEGLAFMDAPVPARGKADGLSGKNPLQIEKALAKLRGSSLAKELVSLACPGGNDLSANVCPWGKVKKMESPSEITFMGGGVSRDSTFGYAYGMYKSLKGSHGNYLHVWRRFDTRSPWRLVVACQEPI